MPQPAAAAVGDPAGAGRTAHPQTIVPQDRNVPMMLRRRTRYSPLMVCLAAACALAEPQTQPSDIRIRNIEYRPPASAPARDASAAFRDDREAKLTAMQSQPVRVAPASRPVRPPASQPSDPAKLRAEMVIELPDPVDAARSFDRRVETASKAVKKDYEKIYNSAKAHVAEIFRPRQVRLGLSECLRRALANNYAIRVEGYGPAIGTAQIVQAEAVFDAAVFGTINATRRDPAKPTIAKRQDFQQDISLYTGGIRQRTVTGAEITLSETLNRTIGPRVVGRERLPQYTSNAAVELRQPLMRNFGIDFNRTQINVSKNTRDISNERFRRQVITTLNDTEKAYWTLVGTRRNVVIFAELLAQAELTLQQVDARREYDAFPTLIANSRSTLFQRQADYIRIKNDIRNAEDQLRNLMSDPELNLSQDVEIITTELPITVPTVRDYFREVEISLERRPEIKEAQLAVDNASLQLGASKNQALPTLDVVLRATFNGFGTNADYAWDQMNDYDFIDKFLGIEFAWNFAERGERAAIRQAALQHSQSVAVFKQAVDLVITDCKVALRAMETSFKQILPSAEAVSSSRENLRSIQEREERKSPEQLNTVFSAQSSVAQTRQSLLQAVVTYNQNIVEVERAKGTLLEYDNVVITEWP